MASPQPEHTRDLNTLVSSTIDGISTGMHNFIDDGRQKLLKKLQMAGQIKTCPDADRWEVLFGYGSDGESWTTYQGDQYGGVAGSPLGHTQAEILSKSFYSLFNRTKNFNIPQKVVNRPVDAQTVDVIAKLGERLAVDALDLEENYLLRGEATGSGTYAALDPYVDDANFDGTKAPMSLLGLLGTGIATPTDQFGYVQVNDHADWAPQVFSATDANPGTDAELRTMLRDIDSAIRNSTFGALEAPTDILTDVPFYERVLQALMTFGRINDTLVRDMGYGANEAIPLSGLRGGIDYSHRLDKVNAWDFGTTPDSVAGNEATNPVIGLNLDSLCMRFVGQPSSMGPEAGWIQQLGDLAAHPTETNWFKRLMYSFTMAVENGRRSFFYIDGYRLT